MICSVLGYFYSGSYSRHASISDFISSIAMSKSCTSRKSLGISSLSGSADSFCNLSKVPSYSACSTGVGVQPSKMKLPILFFILLQILFALLNVFLQLYVYKNTFFYQKDAKVSDHEFNYVGYQCLEDRVYLPSCGGLQRYCVPLPRSGVDALQGWRRGAREFQSITLAAR